MLLSLCRPQTKESKTMKLSFTLKYNGALATGNLPTVSCEIKVVKPIYFETEQDPVVLERVKKVLERNLGDFLYVGTNNSVRSKEKAFASLGAVLHHGNESKIPFDRVLTTWAKGIVEFCTIYLGISEYPEVIQDIHKTMVSAQPKVQAVWAMLDKTPNLHYSDAIASTINNQLISIAVERFYIASDSCLTEETFVPVRIDSIINQGDMIISMEGYDFDGAGLEVVDGLITIENIVIDDSIPDVMTEDQYEQFKEEIESHDFNEEDKDDFNVEVDLGEINDPV